MAVNYSRIETHVCLNVLEGRLQLKNYSDHELNLETKELINKPKPLTDHSKRKA